MFRAWSLKRKKRRLPDIGNREPICPYCSNPLEKMPKRKKKCPHCGNYIYVRKSPKYDVPVLIREDQIDIIEDQRAYLQLSPKEFKKYKKAKEEHKKKLDAIRRELRERIGCEPSEADVQWAYLTQERIAAGSKRLWGIYRNITLQMAEQVRQENKLRQALRLYLEVCYLDVNGPMNVVDLGDTIETIDFDPGHGFLAPYVIQRIQKIVKKLNLSPSEVRKLFLEAALPYQNYPGVRSSKWAWNKVRKELFGDKTTKP